MKKILLVEDDPQQQTLVEDIFRYASLDAQLVCASTATKALKLIDTMSTDVNSDDRLCLVLTDIHMPDFDGISLINVLRKSGNRVPVWGITADATEATRNDGFDAGADDWIFKPVNINELTNKLTTFLTELSYDLSTAGR